MDTRSTLLLAALAVGLHAGGAARLHGGGFARVSDDAWPVPVPGTQETPSSPAAAPGEDRQDGYALDAVMAAPFASDLVAGPDARRVAWVLYEGGRRNLYVAGPPDHRGRRLTDFGADDGRELADPAFTGNGRHVVFVRGGSPNRDGVHPNPAPAPRGTHRALYAVPTAGGELRRLADDGRSPVPAPEGSRVAFVRAGAIWLTDVEGDSARRIVDVQGRPEDITWSPDGRRLAFVSDRGEHALVAVYDLERDELRFPDPGLDEDRSPAWSPDGRRLAFLRIRPEPSEPPYATNRRGLGWSVRLVDLETGATESVWEADQGPGSAFRGLASDRQLFWAAGDRFVFPWERDGWLHLYAVPAEGGEARLLTPGDGIVEFAALTPDREAMLYAANIGDIDRRHVWRVPVSGGDPHLLTPGDGIEWAPVPAAGGAGVAFLASDARRPAHAAILTSLTEGPEPDAATAARRPLAPHTVPDGFPADELIVPEPVVFQGADGLRVRGQLFLPPGASADDPGPAVLFLHGGSRRQMLLGWHYMRYYHNAYALNQYLASQGYVVLALNYRSGIGYGLEFREALQWGARGASEFRDVLGAGRYLRSRPEVDGDRIGLYGGSYGGYLTALGLARASDLFAAGVDFHGVHDWNIEFEWDRRDLPYDLDALEELQELAFRSSPMAHVETWRSPVLFVHGDDDRTVPFRETVELAERLRRRGVPFEHLVLPGEVHDFLRHGSWLKAYRATEEFFDRRLGGRGADGGLRSGTAWLRPWAG